jgi:mRNA interferase MazF
MVDQITTVPRARLGARIGRLADEDMVRLNRAVLVFLGIAAPPIKSARNPHKRITLAGSKTLA